MRRFALLALVLAGGCLDRVETITVFPDGSLEIVHTLAGDPGDLDNGAAARPREPVWRTRRTRVVQDSGDERHTWHAQARFARAADVPRGFGRANDPLAARGLRFKTELGRTGRNGRTIYRFRRVYEARAWGPTAASIRHSFPKELLPAVTTGEGFNELTREEYGQVIAGLVKLQRRLLHHWTAEALRAVEPDDARRMDARVAIGAAIDAYCERHLSDAAIRKLLTRPVEDLDEMSATIQREADARIVETAVRALTLNAAQRDALVLGLRAARHDAEVTHDLNDEAFVVRVRMPGKVTGHNADAVEGPYLVWKFHGDDLRDQRLELFAVSER